MENFKTEIQPIKELTRYYSDDLQDYIYTNDAMINNGLLIQEGTSGYEDENDEYQVDTWIDVHFINDVDAGTYTLYYGELLSGIQTFGIVKDIYEIYKENDLNYFHEIMKDLSSQYITSLSQSETKNKIGVFNRVREIFEYIKDVKD